MSIVSSKTSGGVCTISLDDVERKNSLTPQLLAELMDACDAAEADDSVRVIVLTNSGNTFCAGANLAQRSGRSASEEPVRQVEASDLFGRFLNSPKPYVGKINGHCVAGGMGIAASVDISIAIDTAKMGFTEVRIGVAPAMIAVVCLPKMRPADARAAILRGNRFLAPEAVRMGLINAAVPADQLDAAVDEVVADLLAGSPAALAAAKEIIAQVPPMPVADAFELMSRRSAEMFRSDEAREGMAAYLEKRPASWIPKST